MGEFLEDTIAAIATASGRGGVGVVRVSGPLVNTMIKDLFDEVPQPNKAKLKALCNLNGEMIDKGLLLYFKKPYSFTGEDVLEFHGHGGPVILDMILAEFIHRGARIAQPGEFSKRAFLNNKMDLTQAEAVADLIDATTQSAALSAARSLQGAFSKQINQIAQAVLNLRIFVEAALDFPDEEIDFLEDSKIVNQVECILKELEDLSLKAKQGQIQRDGISIAIVGQPNAGKSSLLNALTRQETAIVTPIAGTTRDLIKEYIQIDGLPVQIIDTAGIRDNPDVIEREGILRAQKQLEIADIILLVVDGTHETMISRVEEKILNDYGNKTLTIVNKIDLTSYKPGYIENKIYISAKEQTGVEALLERIKASCGYKNQESDGFIARRRHLEALAKAKQHIQDALIRLYENSNLELAASSLRFAHEALGEIVGHLSSDDLLGKIFTSFCIGK